MAALKACLKSLDEEQRAELDYYNALNNLSDIEKDQVCYNVVLEKARERMLVIQDITEKSSLCMHELKERLRVTHASADQSAILLEHFREMSGSLLNIRKFHNTLIGAIRGMIQAKKLSKVTLTSDVPDTSVGKKREKAQGAESLGKENGKSSKNMEKEGEEEGEQEGEERAFKSSSRHQTCPMTLLPLSYPLPNHNHTMQLSIQCTQLSWHGSLGKTQL